MTSETAFIFRSRHRIDKYSYLIWLLVVKNIKNKYRRSFLGVFWTVLLPLMEMLVMTMIFSHVNGDIDSRVFIMCGIVVFGFNREATSGAIGSVLGARGLIDRV
ncbi:MAG: ABC transporter permease, partial [Firmicutes bacterium]|nr:ABC transporter permease [Bacillota bacterium]